MEREFSRPTLWNADMLWNKALSEFNAGRRKLSRRTFKEVLASARPGSLTYGYALLYIGRSYDYSAGGKKWAYLHLASDCLAKLERDAASDIFGELCLSLLVIFVL
jgi:hypothetical protein